MSVLLGADAALGGTRAASRAASQEREEKSNKELPMMEIATETMVASAAKGDEEGIAESRERHARPHSSSNCWLFDAKQGKGSRTLQYGQV